LFNTRSSVVIGARSTVALAAPVLRKSPRNDDEPGGKLARPISGERSQAPAIVVAQLLEHERVGIHRRIVIAMNRTHGVKHDATVCRDEPLPGSHSRSLRRRIEKRDEFGR
jgi:hypothetical protein